MALLSKAVSPSTKYPIYTSAMVLFFLTGPDMYNLVPLVEAYVGGSVKVWPRVILYF
jgi:hypothetical protein